MPSLVYTFERIAEGARGNAQSDAVNAIAVAAANEPRIRYEIITDADNPSPMIVVTFPHAASAESFAAKLTQVVVGWGLRIRHVFGGEGENPSAG